MSKDLKDLIDSIEVKNETQNDLERNNDFLQEEVKRLNFRIREQKILIGELNKKIAEGSDVDVPGDVQLLKEMIMSQRQDLIKKDKDIEILQKQLEELTFGIPDGKKSGKSKKNKDLIEAKKRIIQLTEENEILLVNDTNAKKVLEKLANENERLTAKEHEQTNQLQSCVSQIHRLEDRITESKDVKDIEAVKQKNETLLLELNAFQTQVLDLQKELEIKSKDANEYEEMLKDLQSKGMAEGFQSKAPVESPATPSELDSKDLELANQKIESLQEELKDYEAQVLSLQHELDGKKPSQEMPEGEVKPFMEEDELEGLKEEYRVTSRKLDTANITINNLVTEIEGYVKEVSENGEDIRKKNIKINVLNTKIEGLNQQIVEIKNMESQSPESKLDEWYDNKSAETIDTLKIEIERLNGVITELKTTVEPPLVLDEIPDHESAKLGGSSAMPRSKLKEEYDLLVEESQGLIDENERLTEVILELRMAERKREKKAISVAMGVPPEDNSSEMIESLQDENQKLLDKVLELNLKVQDMQTNPPVPEGRDLNEIFKLQAEETISHLQEENQQLNDLILELKSAKTEALPVVDEAYVTQAEEAVKDLELENQRLNDLIKDLKEKEVERPETKELVAPFSADTARTFSHYLPKSYQVNLFLYLINLLDDNLREQMIDTLITHLNSSNIDVKRFVIDVLSEIRTEKTFNAIRKLVNDKNWVIRLCLVKALGKYNNARILEPLDELLNDGDIDIKRAVDKVLKQTSTMPSGEYFRDDLTPNRWNWCEEKGQWVFVEEDGKGRRNYHFQLEPPDEFIELNMKMKEINEKMIATSDVEENQKLFEELMDISARLQEMRKGK